MEQRECIHLYKKCIHLYKQCSPGGLKASQRSIELKQKESGVDQGKSIRRLLNTLVYIVC